MRKSDSLAIRCFLLGALLLHATSLLAKGAHCPAWPELQPMLNSERITACFGSYGVEVLQQEGNLRSTGPAERKCRVRSHGPETAHRPAV